MKIELEENTVKEWFISQLRYSLYLKTFIAEDCIKDLKKYITLLQNKDIQIIIRYIDIELKKCSKWNDYVMIYATAWYEFKYWLEDYLERKEG